MKRILLAICFLAALIPAPSFAQGMTIGPRGDTYIHTPDMTLGPRGDTYIHTPGMTIGPNGQTWIHLDEDEDEDD